MSTPHQEALSFTNSTERPRPRSLAAIDAGTPPELLSIRSAARFLGIGVSTLYALLAEGRFPVPPVKVGNTMKLPRRRLEQWLADGGDVRS
jgi:excisionase family DNA binding protein